MLSTNIVKKGTLGFLALTLLATGMPLSDIAEVNANGGWKNTVNTIPKNNTTAERNGGTAKEVREYEVSADEWNKYKKSNKTKADFDRLMKGIPKTIKYHDKQDYSGTLTAKNSGITAKEHDVRKSHKVDGWNVIATSNGKPSGKDIEKTTGNKSKWVYLGNEGDWLDEFTSPVKPTKNKNGYTGTKYTETIYGWDPQQKKYIKGTGPFEYYKQTSTKKQKKVLDVDNSAKQYVEDAIYRNHKYGRRMGWLAYNYTTYAGRYGASLGQANLKFADPPLAVGKDDPVPIKENLYGEAIDYVNDAKKNGKDALNQDEVAHSKVTGWGNTDKSHPYGRSATTWAKKSFVEASSQSKKRRGNVLKMHPTIKEWVWLNDKGQTNGNRYRKGLQIYYEFPSINYKRYKPVHRGKVTLPKIVNSYKISVTYEGTVYGPPEVGLKANPNPTDRTTATTIDAGSTVDPQTGTKDLTYEFSYKKKDGKDAGKIGTTKSPTSKIKHTFKYVGEYDVTVKVTNKHGKTASKTITVNTQNIRPTAGFTVSDKNIPANEIRKDKLKDYEIWQPVYIKTLAHDPDGSHDTENMSVMYNVTVHYDNDDINTKTVGSKNFVIDKAFLDGIERKRDDVTKITVTQRIQDYPKTGPAPGDYNNGNIIEKTKTLYVEDVSIAGRVEHTERMEEIHKERNGSVSNDLFFNGEDFVLKADTLALFEFRDVKVHMVFGDPSSPVSRTSAPFSLTYQGKTSVDNALDKWEYKGDSNEFWRYKKEMANNPDNINFVFTGTSKFDAVRKDIVPIRIGADINDVFDLNKAYGSN